MVINTYFLKKPVEADIQPYTFYEYVRCENQFGWRTGDVIYTGNAVALMNIDPDERQYFNLRTSGWMPNVSAHCLRKLKSGESFMVTI